MHIIIFYLSLYEGERGDPAIKCWPSTSRKQSHPSNLVEASHWDYQQPVFLSGGFSFGCQMIFHFKEASRTNSKFANFNICHSL